jgi:hypothetical protein
MPKKARTGRSLSPIATFRRPALAKLLALEWLACARVGGGTRVKIRLQRPELGLTAYGGLPAPARRPHIDRP